MPNTRSYLTNKRTVELLKDPEKPRESDLMKWPVGGYETAFDSYFPGRPTEGFNLNHQEQIDDVTRGYIILAHIIKTGRMPLKNTLWRTE